MSVVNMNKISTAVSPLKEQAAEIAEDTPNFTLSKTGTNVVVFMLDRAMGPYIPYLLNEDLQLEQQFDGFTYYSNTLSYGWHTNFASAALFGGYEYTPTELNARSSESLVDKQNEALKVMHQGLTKEETKHIVDWCNDRHLGFYLEANRGMYCNDYMLEQGPETMALTVLLLAAMPFTGIWIGSIGSQDILMSSDTQEFTVQSGSTVYRIELSDIKEVTLLEELPEHLSRKMGTGMDFDQRYRCLPYVGVLKDECYQGK